MRDLSLCDLLLNSCHRTFKSLMALGDDVRQSSFAHRAGEKIVQQLAGALIGQELIVVQIDCRGPGVWAILHRGTHPFGKVRLVQVAAGAKLYFALMLGDYKPPRR